MPERVASATLNINGNAPAVIAALVQGAKDALAPLEKMESGLDDINRVLFEISNTASHATASLGILGSESVSISRDFEKSADAAKSAGRAIDRAGDEAATAGRKASRAGRGFRGMRLDLREFGGDLATLGGQIAGIGDAIPGIDALGRSVTVLGDTLEAGFNPVGAAILAVAGPVAFVTAEIALLTAGVSALVVQSREWVETLDEAGRLSVIPAGALANLNATHDGLTEVNLSLKEAGVLLATEVSPLVLQLEIVAIKAIRSMREGFEGLVDVIRQFAEGNERAFNFFASISPALAVGLAPIKGQAAAARALADALESAQANAGDLRRELGDLTGGGFVGPTMPAGQEAARRQSAAAAKTAEARAAAQLERDIRQGVLRAIPPSIAEGFRDMVEALSILEGQVQLAADLAGLEQSVADAERAIAQGVQEAQGFAAQSAVEGGIGSLRGGLPGILRSVDFMPTNIAAAIIEVLPDVENLLNAVLSQVITTIELVPDVIRAIIGDFLPTLITSLDDIFFAFIDAIGTLPARIIEDLITDFIPALGDLVVQFAEEIRALFTGEGGGQGRRRTAVTLASVAGFLAGGPAGAAAAGSIAFGVGQATRGRRGDGGSFAANAIANPSGAVSGQRGTPRVTVNLSRTGSPTLDTWGQDVARASALATAQGLARPTPLAI